MPRAGKLWQPLEGQRPVGGEQRRHPQRSQVVGSRGKPGDVQGSVPLLIVPVLVPRLTPFPPETAALRFWPAPPSPILSGPRAQSRDRGWGLSALVVLAGQRCESIGVLLVISPVCLCSKSGSWYFETRAQFLRAWYPRNLAEDKLSTGLPVEGWPHGRPGQAETPEKGREPTVRPGTAAGDGQMWPAALGGAILPGRL